MNDTVGIVGASGWLGKHLSRELLSRGWQVVGFSRSRREDETMEWRQWDGESVPDLAGLDAVINLAGESIDRRWSEKVKKKLTHSRVAPTEHLSKATRDSAVKVLLNASAIGFYGDRGDEILPETAEAGEGFLAELCQKWEMAADPLSDVRLCYLRTGVVLGKGGPAWESLSKVFKFGAGGKLGNGRQWMPWIHLDDEIGAIIHCLEHTIAGPVNLVAPESVRNAEFTKALGEALHRPAFFTVPSFVLKLILGEFAEEGLLASVRVAPTVLEKSGYRFRFRTIREAFADLTA